MLGAIAGDVIGSVYEGADIKTPHFYPLIDAACRFTDDTVLTVAVADAILTGGDYVHKLKEYFRLYPYAGYGGTFVRWAASASREPYNSWGNGSAMRVSPVGFAYGSLEEVLLEAKRSAEVTHNHPEGVKGAQATAAAVFLARTGKSKVDIKDYVQSTFGYDLDRGLWMSPPRLRLRRVLPGVGAGIADRLSGIGGLRGRGAQGDFAGRRRRHHGLHRRRRGPGVLRRRPRRNPRRSVAPP